MEPSSCRISQPTSLDGLRADGESRVRCRLSSRRSFVELSNPFSKLVVGKVRRTLLGETASGPVEPFLDSNYPLR
jgi:hypothetical protein